MKTLSRFLSGAIVIGATLLWFHPASGAAPPMQDLKYWMSADSSDNAPAPETVYEWRDQSPGGGHHGAALGAPMLAQASFPQWHAPCRPL